MSFLDSIKRDIKDVRLTRGMGLRYSVRSVDLDNLIYHYERLESLHKADYLAKTGDIDRLLEECLRSTFFNNDRDPEMVMLLIMDTIGPLIREKLEKRRV